MRRPDTPTPTGLYSGVARRAFDQKLWGTIREYAKTGWSNYNGMEFELERRYSKGVGFQLSYVVGNTLAAGATWGPGVIPATNQFMPGTVPDDYDQRNRLLNYQRDTEVPKHRVRWNWIVDLPFGKGKAIGGNADGVLDKFIGGWQIAGMGNLRSNYFSLPTNNWNLTGEQIETVRLQVPYPGLHQRRLPTRLSLVERVHSVQSDQQRGRQWKAQRVHGDTGELQAGGDSADPVGQHRTAAERTGKHQYPVELGYQ